MFYDIRVSAKQLVKLGAWVERDMADVELVVDDSMLLAEQGDDRMAWDADGSEASEEYLAKAPLDPSRPYRPARLDPGRARPIGYAHIYVDSADRNAPAPMYAACPMYPDNLELLRRWLDQNHAALAAQAQRGK